MGGVGVGGHPCVRVILHDLQGYTPQPRYACVRLCVRPSVIPRNRGMLCARARLNTCCIRAQRLPSRLKEPPPPGIQRIHGVRVRGDPRDPDVGSFGSRAAGPRWIQRIQGVRVPPGIRRIPESSGYKELPPPGIQRSGARATAPAGAGARPDPPPPRVFRLVLDEGYARYCACARSG